jgi:monovalent cation:H+ antiporter-2, CPA2 family
MNFHRDGAGSPDLISRLKGEAGSAVADKSPSELDLMRRYGVTVLVLRKGAQSVSGPSGPDRLETDSVAVVMGSNEQIAGVSELFRSERAD